MMHRSVFLFFCLFIFPHFFLAAQETPYFNNRVVFKLKTGTLKNNDPAETGYHGLTSIMQNKHIKEIRQPFAFIKNVPKNPTYDLSTIYELVTDGNIAVAKLIQQIIETGEVVYAEPRYKSYILDLPDDPYVASQYYLTVIKAFESWQINQGDSNIIIGIVDTGIDIDHEDLIDNIFYNLNDPINGIDDDNDGFTDNYRGWDMGCNDNNPQIETNPHGIRVSGIAAARTNNGKGIAGTGYRTKFLPVKISDASDILVNDYEGAVYAAEMGSHIINCSWGSTFYSNLGKDVADYICLEKNILLVAAAGNANNEDYYYPASYDHVFSIAATNNLDHKWSSSTYNSKVDFCAPGENIFSPGLDNTYAFRSGTSYASPIVAACAAIVKAARPQYSGIQLGEILRRTTDIIDTIPANQPYSGKLGSGRVNLYRAISDPVPASVVFHNIINTDYADNLFRANDTVFVSGTLTNYLIPVSYVTITASSNSPYIRFISNLFQTDNMATLQSLPVSNSFCFIIDNYTPADEYIYIKLSISAGGYSQEQFIKIKLNQSYINLQWDDAATTASGNGKIGYASLTPPEGNGFIIGGKQLLYEAGFIAGKSNYQVSSCFRGYDDFKMTNMIGNVAEPGNDSLIKTHVIYNDQYALDHALNIEVTQNTLCWNKPGLNFIIWEFTIKNITPVTHSQVYAGIFTDWDIPDFNQNQTGFFEEYACSYTRTTSGELIYAGISFLNDYPVKHYAFDNIDSGLGGINITDGLSIEERWFALTNNRHNAGATGNGNDVAQITSAGPMTILPYDSIKLAFAILSAGNEYNLKKLVQKARSYYFRYNDMNEIPVTSHTIYPNPTNEYLNLKMPVHTFSDYSIFSTDGRLIISGNLQSDENTIMVSDIGEGLYFLKIISGKTTQTYKIVISR